MREISAAIDLICKQHSEEFQEVEASNELCKNQENVLFSFIDSLLEGILS